MNYVDNNFEDHKTKGSDGTHEIETSLIVQATLHELDRLCVVIPI